MVTAGDYNYHGEPWLMHRTVESICWTPETNKALYVNYISIIKKKACAVTVDSSGIFMFVEVLNMGS